MFYGDESNIRIQKLLHRIRGQFRVRAADADTAGGARVSHDDFAYLAHAGGKVNLVRAGDMLALPIDGCGSLHRIGVAEGGIGAERHPDARRARHVSNAVSMTVFRRIGWGNTPERSAGGLHAKISDDLPIARVLAGRARIDVLPQVETVH